MGLYDFNSGFSVENGSSSQVPPGLAEIPAVRQLSHVEGGRNPFDGSDFLAYSDHVEEFLIPGFRSLDDAMKQYWSGIRVPTKDSYRFMRVKVAGGDKSLLIWADELNEGRARLPVGAVSREGHEFNADKFSPAYHHMDMRYLSRRYDQVALVYRPTPWLVDYNLIIWAERKRDAEYILYQVLTRFNPLGGFRMFDGKLVGNCVLRFGGSTDASDKETGFDQHAQIRYEFSITAEAWLPLPERIVKTVLGRTTVLREQSGTIFAASRSHAVTGGGHEWFTPIQ